MVNAWIGMAALVVVYHRAAVPQKGPVLQMVRWRKATAADR